VQALDKYLVDELIGRHPGQFGGERQHEENVGPELFDQLGPAAKGGELRWVATGTDYLRGVRVEGHQHAGNAQVSSSPHGLPDQLGVTAVHPVEHPDRDHAAAPTARDGL
jgi:hypothetical protein